MRITVYVIASSVHQEVQEGLSVVERPRLCLRRVSHLVHYRPHIVKSVFKLLTTSLVDTTLEVCVLSIRNGFNHPLSQVLLRDDDSVRVISLGKFQDFCVKHL